MTDKLTKTFLEPNFQMGEQPTAQKLQYSFALVGAGLEKVEVALADIGDADAENVALSSLPLRLSGLGRLLGPLGANDGLAGMDSPFAWTATLATDRNEWLLPHWPVATATTTALSLTPTGAATWTFQNDVGTAVPAEVGDWGYDPVTNRIRSFARLTGGAATVVSTTVLRSYISMPSLSFYSHGHGAAQLNVYPSIKNATCTSISVATSTSTAYDFIVTLNPEVALQRSPIRTTALARSDEKTFELFDGRLKDRRGANMWVALGAAPQYLPTALHGYSAEEEIPTPFVRLWDETNGAVIPGRLFWRDSTSLFYKRGVPLSVNGSTAYRVLALGNSIAESVEGLRHDMIYHQHEGPQAIGHDSLLGNQYPGPSDGVVAVATDPRTGWWKPSVQSLVPGNVHPQYLHRAGYDGGIDAPNFRNAMLGDLLFARRPSSTHIALSSATELFNDTSIQPSPGLAWGGDAHSMKLRQDVPEAAAYLSLAYIQHVRGNTSGITLATSNTNVSILHACTHDFGSTQARIFLGSNLDASVLSNGTAEVSLALAQNAGFSVRGPNGVSFVTVTNGEAEVVGSANTVSGNPLVSSKVSVVGVSNAVVVKGTALSVEVAGSGLTLGTANFPVSHGRYEKYSQYVADADERYLWRSHHPRDFIVAYNPDSGAAGTAVVPFDDLLLPMPISPFFRAFNTSGATATRNGLGLQEEATAISLVLPLNMPGDSFVREVQVGMTYQAAALELYYQTLDGRLFLATSTTLANQSPAAAYAAVTWDVGTALDRTLGSRWPTTTSSGIDMLLAIRVNSTDVATEPHIQVHGVRSRIGITRF